MKKFKNGLFFISFIFIFSIININPHKLYFIHPGLLAQTASSNVTITSPDTANAVIHQPFSFTITANPPATNFTATQLPDGLKLNPTTGLISGTPQSEGNFTGITLTAGNGTNNVTQDFTLTVTSADSNTNSSTPSNETGGCLLTKQNNQINLFGFFSWIASIALYLLMRSRNRQLSYR